MNKVSITLTAFFCIILAAFKTDNLPSSFVDRLNRSHMTFTAPAQYEEAPIVSNNQMHYEYALRRSKDDFEVRYAINRLDSVFIQFNAMKKNTVSLITPNKLYYEAFVSTMANISSGKRATNMGTFYPNEVKRTFNADWAAFCYCEPSGNFGKGYISIAWA